jgi:hypothetical protein
MEAMVPETKQPFDPEQMQTMLEHLRFEVQGALEHSLMSREHAHDFAKVAIQSTFLLNGGALIAFPTFAQLVGIGLHDHIGLGINQHPGFRSWSDILFIGRGVCLSRCGCLLSSVGAP